MKKAFYIFTIITALTTSVSFAKNSIPLSSGEDLNFISAEENNLINLNKTKNFKGILIRSALSQQEGSQLDVYEFETDKYSVDKKLCTKVLELIYGPIKKISLQLSQQNLFAITGSNSACEAILNDPDPQAVGKEHRFYAIILQNKLIGLEARFKKPATKTQIEDLQNFIKKLKPPKEKK